MAIDLVNVSAGAGGFVIHGQDAGDEAGRSVSSAGDINGDGFDDIIIGAEGGDGPGNTRVAAGDSYVVFGKASGFAAEIDLAAVAAGNGGFVIHGQDGGGDASGQSVSSAGDVNGDGFDDIIIGAPVADGAGNTHDRAGDSYVVFGHAGGFAAEIDLATVAAGNGGFVIHGHDVGDDAGFSVSSADVNGDGFADLIIGAQGGDGASNSRPGAGESYVVFGHAGGFAAEIDLAAVAAGNGGFVIYGQDDYDSSGWSVSSAGDVNGDGFDDLIIGAVSADGPGNTRNVAGDSYVIFGKASGFAAQIDLAAVAAGTGGFVIHGQDATDDSGISVSSAGDVNGDGFDDLLIGAFGGDGPGNTRDHAGDSYVVFGHVGRFAAEIDLATVAAGNGGFVIHGEDAGDSSGWSVSLAGDVNGDGFDDIIIGAYSADGPGNTRSRAGDSYVVFGHAGGFGAEIDLATVAAGNGGFVIHGQDGDGNFPDVGDMSGFSVSSAGDINGDGFDDLIIGAPFGNGPGNTRLEAGDSYVLFGSGTIGDSVNHVTHLGTTADDILIGDSAPNDMVGGIGNDVLIANGGADVLRGGAGNDTLVISNNAFVRIDGGDGIDTLAFSGAMILSDADFRQIDGIESIRLANAPTTLILGAIASNAIDALQVAIDGTAVTNAAVNIDSNTSLTRALSVNLANDAANVILRGGSGNDTLVGGKGDDFFDGEAGADAITGGGGNDTVSYGSSALAVGVNLATGLGSGGDATGDTLTGIENVFGSNQGDILTGNDGANTLSGFSGNDMLNGDGGDDVVIGGPGNDAAFLGAGNDIFQWNQGDFNDTVDGQDGIDRLDFNGASFAEKVDISANGERAHVTRDVDTVTMDLNDVENTTVNVLGGADVINVNDLSGTDVTDVVIRLAGTLGGNTGDNQVDQTIVNGSNGDDVVGILGQNGFLAVAGLAALVSISTSEATDALIVKGGTGNDNLSALTLPAGNTALTLDGGVGNDTLVGSLGADVLLGGDGNDTLTGGAGNDALFGGAGNDIYFVDGAGDGVVENANEGNDTVFSTNHLRLSANVETLVLQGNADLQGYGNSLNNLIQGNAGSNLLDGDAGADVMVGGAGNDVYFVDNAGDVVVENANEGNDVVFSTAHFQLSENVETLVLQGTADLQGYGNSQANMLFGNTGNNLLDGRAGADNMLGGLGNDVYFVDDAGDVVFENANEGNDAVFSTAHFQLSENVEILVLQGSADLQGYGNSQANTLFGNSGSNLLDGRGGADNMLGGLGNDVYFVDDAGDLVFENANEGTDAVFSTVNYTLTANVETLVLQGGGNLSGTGNALANSIVGNSGNNILDGGAGADALTGGAGNDTFVFRAGQANNDTVVDFIGNGAAAGDALQFVGFGTAAQGATFTQIGASNQWQIHSGLDGHNEIVTFSNAAVIHSSDLLFL